MAIDVKFARDHLSRKFARQCTSQRRDVVQMNVYVACKEKWSSRKEWPQTKRKRLLRVLEGRLAKAIEKHNRG